MKDQKPRKKKFKLISQIFFEKEKELYSKFNNSMISDSI
jgi:hypothetical protein